MADSWNLAQKGASLIHALIWSHTILATAGDALCCINCKLFEVLRESQTAVISVLFQTCTLCRNYTFLITA